MLFPESGGKFLMWYKTHSMLRSNKKKSMAKRQPNSLRRKAMELSNTHNNQRGKRHGATVYLNLKMTVLQAKEYRDSQQAFRSRGSYD